MIINYHGIFLKIKFLKKKLITILGTIEPRKNIEIVLDLISKNRNLIEEYQFIFPGRYGWGESVIEKTITQTIINYEPRVNLDSVDVNVNPDNNSVYVSIEFKIVNTEKPLTVDFTLQRTR